MANYCINEKKSKDCRFLYKGVVIGTDKGLCNIFSEDRPCPNYEHDSSSQLFGDVNDDDFIEFFNKSRLDILKPLHEIKDENILKRLLFKDAKYMPASQIMDIYRDSDYHLMHLNTINFGYFKYLKNLAIESNFIFELCIKKFPNPKNIQVLDYGCGSGIYGLKLALAGYDVTLADLPSKTFKFIQFICKKHNLKVKFQELSGDNYALFGKFDYIICTDVLEHVDEPEELLRILIEHMDDNGWIFIATFFDDMQGQDPSHLLKNTMRYNDYQRWLGKVIQMGLVPLENDPRGCERGFKKLKSIH